MSLSRRLLSLTAILAMLSACAAEPGDPGDLGVAGSGGGVPSFEEFMASVQREPFEGGVWIVDGDVPIDSEKRLVDYYDNLAESGGLTVARYGGQDEIWAASKRRDLTYCVSTTFGSRYDRVVAAMASATSAWAAVADVGFRHVEAEDSRCTASNGNVVFDVRPVSGQSYLARSFFPYQSRSTSNVLIDSSSFGVYAPLTLEGILRHELGHVLGFRHEHTRPEAGQCYEDSNWRAVTQYDRGSVMHYPQCGGTNEDLHISELDAQGAAALYGAPSGGSTGGSTGGTTPPPPAPSGTPSSGSADGTVAADQEQRYQAIDAVAGTTFRVAMTGSGDADLYVRFGSAPTTSSYACRPYRSDANETCELTVPSSATEAYIMVRGYTDASYHIDVSWTAP